MLAAPVRQAFQPSASYRETHTCTILRVTYGRTAGVQHLFAAYKLGSKPRLRRTTPAGRCPGKHCLKRHWLEIRFLKV